MFICYSLYWLIAALMFIGLSGCIWPLPCKYLMWRPLSLYLSGALCSHITQNSEEHKKTLFIKTECEKRSENLCKSFPQEFISTTLQQFTMSTQHSYPVSCFFILRPYFKLCLLHICVFYLHGSNKWYVLFAYMYNLFQPLKDLSYRLNSQPFLTKYSHSQCYVDVPLGE